MADIELVIKISEELYEKIRNLPNFISADATQVIRDGTPLSKGHGDLKDVNEIWHLYDYNDIDYTMIDALNDAPTIIEEDKEYKNETD